MIEKILNIATKHQGKTELVFRGLFAATAIFEKDGRRDMAERGYLHAAQLGTVPREINFVSRVLSRLGSHQVERAISSGLEDFAQGRQPVQMLEAAQRINMVVDQQDLAKLGGNHE